MCNWKITIFMYFPDLKRDALIKLLVKKCSFGVLPVVLLSMKGICRRFNNLGSANMSQTAAYAGNIKASF